MPKKSIPYEIGLHERLKDPVHALNYIKAAAEDSMEGFLLALRDYADATKGMAKVAELSDKNRENLYRMLSEEGNPRLESLWAVAGAMGLQITVQSTEPTPITVRQSRTTSHQGAKNKLEKNESFRELGTIHMCALPEFTQGTSGQRTGYIFPEFPFNPQTSASVPVLSQQTKTSALEWLAIETGQRESISQELVNIYGR